MHHRINHTNETLVLPQFGFLEVAEVKGLLVKPKQFLDLAVKNLVHVGLMPSAVLCCEGIVESRFLS
jgi:hypothetical protein